MKCHVITRLLDERDSADWSAAESDDVDAHLEGCPDCASQFRVSQRLTAFRADVPALPVALRERVRAARDAAESCDDEIRLRRPVIIGSLLLLGSAATMFAGAAWRDTSAASQ